MCFLVEVFLRRADPSSRGILPTVMCHCVRSRNLKNEAALARFGLLRQRRRTNHITSKQTPTSPRTLHPVFVVYLTRHQTLTILTLNNGRSNPLPQKRFLLFIFLQIQKCNRYDKENAIRTAKHKNIQL